MINLIAFFCFLGASLVICGLSSFLTKPEKPAYFILLKAGAIFSIVVLLIASANLSSSFGGSAIFILIALISFMISEILKAIPTKNDVFSLVNQILTCISSFSLCISALLILSSPIALPVGFGVGGITAITFFAVKKKFDPKTNLAPSFEFAFSLAFLAQTIFSIIFLQGISNILLLAGATILVTFECINFFIKTDEFNKKLAIVKNILLYASLIAISASVFF